MDYEGDPMLNLLSTTSEIFVQATQRALLQTLNNITLLDNVTDVNNIQTIDDLTASPTSSGSDELRYSFTSDSTTTFPPPVLFPPPPPPPPDKDDNDPSLGRAVNLLGNDELRASYWGAFMFLALALLIGCMVFAPPPERTWPRKKPLFGCVPTFVWARMLGYGCFDWRTGELLSLKGYFLERHEWLCICFGDDLFIPRKSRALMLMVDTTATFSLNMVLSDPEIKEEDDSYYWARQMGKFGALYVHQLVLSIALRLASIGAKHARHSTRFRFTCFIYCLLLLLAGGIFSHLIQTPDCNDFCKFADYLSTFVIFELTWGNIIQPTELLFRWCVGCFLFWISKDYPNDEARKYSTDEEAEWRNRMSSADGGRIEMQGKKLDGEEYDPENPATSSTPGMQHLVSGVETDFTKNRDSRVSTYHGPDSPTAGRPAADSLSRVQSLAMLSPAGTSQNAQAHNGADFMAPFLHSIDQTTPDSSTKPKTNGESGAVGQGDETPDVMVINNPMFTPV